MSNCEPVENVGVSNLERFEYSVGMEIDEESCEYTLQMKFKHDETLPVPNAWEGQCDPTIVPPVLASDNLPYFAFRWAYEAVPNYIKKATGIDHFSIDFNSCGHPPEDVFNIPHYDFHVYRVDPEFRACMTCAKVTGAPVCDPKTGAQETTSNGLGFFNVNTILGTDGDISNMPDGFKLGMGDMVPLMGGHAWNVADQPNAANPWTEPVTLMGNYDGELIFFETMVPLTFVSGADDNSSIEEVTYKGQTITELPSMYKVEYDATTKFTTFTFKGASLLECNASKKSGSKSKKSGSNKSKKSGSESKTSGSESKTSGSESMKSGSKTRKVFRRR
jgi:hypothetical protein